MFPYLSQIYFLKKWGISITKCWTVVSDNSINKSSIGVIRPNFWLNCLDQAYKWWLLQCNWDCVVSLAWKLGNSKYWLRGNSSNLGLWGPWVFLRSSCMQSHSNMVSCLGSSCHLLLVNYFQIPAVLPHLSEVHRGMWCVGLVRSIIQNC